jgi:hypothetical protein
MIKVSKKVKGDKYLGMKGVIKKVSTKITAKLDFQYIQVLLKK